MTDRFDDKVRAFVAELVDDPPPVPEIDFEQLDVTPLQPVDRRQLVTGPAIAVAAFVLILTTVGVVGWLWSTSDVEPASPDRTPDERAESRETTRAVQAALLELTPEHRVMIVLRHFESLSYEEMAEVAGIPEKTVKSRLFAARRKLRSLLTGRGLLSSDQTPS